MCVQSTCTWTVHITQQLWVIISSILIACNSVILFLLATASILAPFCFKLLSRDVQYVLVLTRGYIFRVTYCWTLVLIHVNEYSCH